ncbi:Methyltransferase-like protein 7B [Araneus ventricosus]|uniref:Methyltransferase-like protein 7B n=1 Tax=Araneus ventricosus TaxID=182803 RepID=A0A4Y2FH88_ARAVE|nr:Methyltransferase-like protein 7B [Araneus ventricosus]
MEEKHVVVEILWLFAGIAMWVLATTVALPITAALFFSTAFQDMFFSWAYVHIIQFLFQSKLVSLRKKMFQLLQKGLSPKERPAPLEVLEIGIGDGANLPYYPENCKLTVLDKNKFFEPYFRSNAKMYPHISYQRTVIQSAENMKDVEDNSMDVVVTSLFQCSCDDPDKVLQEILRVLKPGGKYVCLEHVAFPKNSVGLLLQKFVHPIWCLYSNGCTLDRDLVKKIKQAGFSEVACEQYVAPQWWMYIAKHFIVAVATK